MLRNLLKKTKKPIIAVALGGGGVRGLAHIGVLEVLEEHGIKPDIVVGTSAGSIVGALYCDNPDVYAVKDKMLHIKRKDVMHFSPMSAMNIFAGPYSPMSLDRLVSFLKDNLSTLDIGKFKLKYAAVSTDLKRHCSYTFDSGSVIDGILASTALPPIFSPYKFNDLLLVDGGITHPVPVEIARSYGPDIVIAVNINSPGQDNSGYSMMEVTMSAFMTSYYSLSVEQSKQADFIIHPNLQRFNIFADTHNQEIYEIGREEARRIAPKIAEHIA